MEHFYESATMLNASLQADLFGGNTVVFTDGRRIQAAFTAAAGADEIKAGKASLLTGIRIAVPLGTGLVLGDHVRRDSTGTVYRVTSNSADERPPAFAGLKFEWCNAEVIRI